ncbi:hypothetical protein B0T20DRAFT_54586 [Sordaria brevicollis]|uniref:Rhodopsin domain-containing protein n=1 Tax=Sordaria brevicollis TaxID=83679 RepID=A0AAE0P3L6_SORBR|nr:hypothetical protein B0T20DRAFT_54586 [Sordaria brevicollis]
MEFTPEMLAIPSTLKDKPYNDLQIGTFIGFGVTYFVATLFLVFRYMQAFKITKKVELDLAILTISWVLALVYFITMYQLMAFGWARHVAELVPIDFVHFNKGLLPNTLTYLITPAVTKMAMCAVLYRISPSRTYRFIVIAIAVAIFIYTLVLTSITGGPCNPLKTGTTKCLENVALSQAVLNIASDLAVIAVPIPTIHKIQTSLKQKILVGALLCLGSGVVVCSIVRLPQVLALDTSPGSTVDITYEEGVLGVWSIIEVNLGIVCGCGMRLKQLIQRYWPKLGMGSWGSSAKRSQVTHDTSGMRTGEFGNGDGHVHGTKQDGKYQLHSIQKGNKDETFVTVEDGGSTDSILR